MNSMGKFFALSALLVLSTGVAEARVRAWIVINPFAVAPPPRPVVVEQPVVVADPYAVPAPDYSRMLADFHARVQRLRRVLDGQLKRGIISQRTYDRHADDLEALVRDEQREAAEYRGALTPRQIDELNRRLTELQDRVHEDLAR